MAKQQKATPSPFNSPVECGVRSLTLLQAVFPKACDLARLVVYDYLLVHSGDVSNESLAEIGVASEVPESLHPATPNRSGELLVRREMIRAGLELMMKRGLVIPKFGSDGITYAATGLTSAFIAVLESGYTRDLVSRAEWVASAFGGMGDNELATFAISHLRDWGGEFMNESLLRSQNQ